MKQIRRFLLSAILLLAIAYFLIGYPLPYYIYTPGSAEPLDDIVHVEGGHISEGDMHLVTVSGMQATALQLILAKIQPFSEIVPLNRLFQKA